MDVARPDLKQKKQRKRLVLGATAGVIALLGVVGLSRLEPAAPEVDAAAVWTDVVKRGEMLREVRGPGTLVPKEIRWIAAETSARVERILIKPGATVAADSIVLELSNPEVDEQLLAAQSAVAAAEADYTATRVQLENQLLDQEALVASTEADHEGARLQAEAEGELKRRGIVSAIQYRQSQLRADQLGIKLRIEHERAAKFRQNIDAQLAASRARKDQLQNTLALRQRQADSLRVRAGIAGVLQQVPVEEGQQVIAGTNLARVARPDVLMAELRIPETQAKDVAMGQRVAVDTRNGVVEGRVMRIDPAVQAGTVQVDVELVGALPSGARPDLSVDGTIEIERLADVVYVGRPAFGQPGSTVGLFRLDEDSDIARRVPVKLGRASVSVIEVAQGLQPGDKVILSDTSAWDEFDRIRLD